MNFILFLWILSMCRRITHKLSKARPNKRFAGVYTSLKSTEIIINSLYFQFCHQIRIFVENIVHITSRRKEIEPPHEKTGVTDQVRPKLACSATDASIRLEILGTD